MSAEALSKRESEILGHLVDGGRVSTIAEKLFLSPHTVRNHLRNIFWKLGVHSQAKLVEHVRQNPSILADLRAGAAPGTGDPDELMRPYNQANARLAKEIDTILREKWGPEGLRELLRVALPLDEERKAAWRHRLDLWSRERSDPELTARRDEQMAPWRKRAAERIQRAQKDGWLRADRAPDELLQGLFALMVGISLQILKEPSPAAEAVHLRLMDAYIDDLLAADGPAH